MSDEFDWFEDEDVIVTEQRATAVYEHTSGKIVMRQERAWDEDYDKTMAFHKEHVVALVYALLDAAQLPMQTVEAAGGRWSDVENPNTARREMLRQQASRTDAMEADAFPEPVIEAAPEKPKATLPERRARAIAILTADPSKSNRAIAAESGVSDKTVASLRAELDAETGAEKENRDAEQSAELPTPDAENQQGALLPDAV